MPKDDAPVRDDPGSSPVTDDQVGRDAPSEPPASDTLTQQRKRIARLRSMLGDR